LKHLLPWPAYLRPRLPLRPIEQHTPQPHPGLERLVSACVCVFINAAMLSLASALDTFRFTMNAPL
jgi:hypothetical protein